HTAAATAQLDALVEYLGQPPVVVPTSTALADPVAAGRAAAANLRETLATRGVAILSSERIRQTAHDSLAHGELVMRALMAAADVVAEAGTIVSKGGITSAEVARTALGARRAWVRGQVAAGISVWDHPDGTVQIVVPGNVGGRETLADVMGLAGPDRINSES